MKRHLATAILAAASAMPAAAQFQSSSGMYFQSAGAAYMNTLSWSSMSRTPEMRKAMADAEARANAKAGTPARAAPPPSPSPAAALAASSFTLVPDERGKVLDSLLSKVPAGPARDAQRARIDALSAQVEKGLSPLGNNLAEATCLLIGTSLRVATGKAPETARMKDVVRAVSLAYATDERFKRLDDRRRSHMYYLYTATIGTTLSWGISKDPTEAQAGKALALGTLREFGIAL